MLIQQGVSVDELRLYGENAGGSDSSDNSLLEESFSELEDVISQVNTKIVFVSAVLSKDLTLFEKFISFSTNERRV